MSSVSEVVYIRKLQAPCLCVFNSLLIEIRRVCRSVVLINDLDNGIGKSFLFRELDTIFRMLGDDSNALHDAEFVVRVLSAMLVLSEILRILEFADIVIVSCNLAKERIGADSFSGGVGEVSNHHRMLMCAGSLKEQTLHKVLARLA